MTDSRTAQIDEQAAVWFSRRQARALSAAEQAEFSRWLAASPEHAQAYADIQLLWDDCDLLERPALASPATVRSITTSRPRRLRSVTALAAAVLLGVGLLLLQQWQAPVMQLTASAGLDDIRHILLEDGSELMLNLGSTAEVRYYDDRREVTLVAGEAFFAVAKDAERPFRISAGDGQVEVVGTRFNVRRSDTGLAVAVEQGRVKVEPGRSELPAQELTPGQRIEIDYATATARSTRLPLAEVGSWRSGLLVFHDRPLSELAQELARYRGQAVRVTDPELLTRRLSGTLDIHHPDRFLRALPQLLPVELTELADGSIQLTGRK